MSADRERCLRLGAYLLTILAGLWLPSAKIISHVFPAREPALYRFAAENPHDGSDPFRGRYVRLRLASLPFQPTAGQTLPNGRVYAALSRDACGLAAIAAVSGRLFKERDSIRVEIDYTANSQKKNVWYLAPYAASCFLGGKLTREDVAALRRTFDSAGRKFTAVVKVYPDGSCETVSLEVNGKDIAEELRRKQSAVQ